MLQQLLIYASAVSDSCSLLCGRRRGRLLRALAGPGADARAPEALAGILYLIYHEGARCWRRDRVDVYSYIYQLPGSPS